MRLAAVTVGSIGLRVVGAARGLGGAVLGGLDGTIDALGGFIGLVIVTHRFARFEYVGDEGGRVGDAVLILRQ